MSKWKLFEAMGYRKKSWIFWSWLCSLLGGRLWFPSSLTKWEENMTPPRSSEVVYVKIAQWQTHSAWCRCSPHLSHSSLAPLLFWKICCFPADHLSVLSSFFVVSGCLWSTPGAESSASHRCALQWTWWTHFKKLEEVFQEKRFILRVIT